MSKEHKAEFRILIPTRASAIKATSIIAKCSIRINCIYCLFDSLGLSLFINDSLFYFLGLNIESQFLIDTFTETLLNATTVFLETTIHESVSSSQRCISLTKNTIRCYNTCQRKSTKSNCRCIQLEQFYASSSVYNCKILLTIFYSIFFRQHFRMFGNLVNCVNILLSLVEYSIYFSSSLTCHNSTNYSANNTNRD